MQVYLFTNLNKSNVWYVKIRTLVLKFNKLIRLKYFILIDTRSSLVVIFFSDVNCNIQQKLNYKYT